LDAQFGRVLQAIDDAGLSDDTIVICTTDHGLAFPHMKCNCNDFGTGVFGMLRWPKRIPQGQVHDALVSQMDIFPTLCEWLEVDKPDWLQGESLDPLIDNPQHPGRDTVFGEVTYHAATEPMRSARSNRWLYIRRWEQRLRPVGFNVDVSYSKEFLVEYGLAQQTYASEELYDCIFDPMQRANVIDDGKHAEVLADMRSRMDRWMIETEDPLLSGIHSLPPNPTEEDPDDFDTVVGGAPLPALPERLSRFG
jgi:arylsulfatase A-like enzyme